MFYRREGVTRYIGSAFYCRGCVGYFGEKVSRSCDEITARVKNVVF